MREGTGEGGNREKEREREREREIFKSQLDQLKTCLSRLNVT